jgi:hypothetical protein
MQTPRFMFASVLLFAAFAADGAPAQQQAVSSGDLRMRVVDGLTGQPVPRVRFTLTGGGLVDALAGSGDAQGDAVLSEVPPSGSYQLTVTKAGYFDAGYTISRSSGSTSSLPDIVLTAKREISGIVRWQDGEVAARAQVRVMGVRGGKAVNRNDIPAVAANDRGEFVVGNLRPGRYILLVSPPNFIGGIDNSGRFVSGGVPRLAVPVFYPGVSAPDPRTSIDLRGTLNAPNIGIVLEEKPGTMVEGTVIPSPAAPSGSMVSLTLTSSGQVLAGAQARSGDAFRIGPVPSGFYVLDAQGTGGQASRAFLFLTIGGATLGGVTVSLPPPAALSGVVEIDDPAVRLTANLRLQSERTQATNATNANAGGEFRIPFVVAGEVYGMTVTLSTSSVAYIADVRQGVQQKPVSPFPVAAGGDPVRIVLKTDGGTIQGVAKLDGRALAKAFVVLAPKDRKLEQTYRTATAEVDGTYKLSAIAPGDYEVFAFDRNEDDDYLDELFLRNFADRAVEVKVAPRSTGTVEVAVTNIPRR